MTAMLEAYQVRQRISMPMEAKVAWARRAIREWYDRWDGLVYVAFSGGLDSTALLHVVRKDYPDVPAVFWDTGLELPEIREQARAADNCEFRKPKKTFREVIDRYGYPVANKRVAQYVYEARKGGPGSNAWKLRCEGIKINGEYSRLAVIPKKWRKLLHAPFIVSDRCCNVMKKQPAYKYEKETGRKAILGVTAAESNQRFISYSRYGCNAGDLNHPRSWPLAIWTRANVLEYISSHSLPYASLYDNGYNRTGCAYCAFGAHYGNPNQFELLASSHPKLWKYCMSSLGMKEVLAFCNIRDGSERQALLF